MRTVIPLTRWLGGDIVCPPVDADIRDLPSILFHSPISVLEAGLAFPRGVVGEWGKWHRCMVRFVATIRGR